MANVTPDNDFSREVSCTYKNEQYWVRDNGTVLRKPRVVTRPRPYDNQWTFGKSNSNGYMEIASVPIHRIVATAFHGAPPSKDHIADHIDTNKHNNRPENLRWVTRLENILLNPITAKRIVMICGSVEAFLTDPSKFFDKLQKTNNNWMRPVTAEEAKISLARLLSWAKNDKHSSGGSLDEWIFSRSTYGRLQVDSVPQEPELIKSITLNAAQRKWQIPSEFPCCPGENTAEPLVTYNKRLVPGSIFCRNNVYSSLALRNALSADHQTLFVLSKTTDEEAIKPWALAKITYENELFIHTSIRSFFTEIGAEKQYVLAQDLEWTGSDSIDDYC